MVARPPRHPIMFQSITNSWHLTVQSFRVLRQDKELMILPILSGLAVAAISALFLAPLIWTGGLEGVIAGESANTVMVGEGEDVAAAAERLAETQESAERGSPAADRPLPNLILVVLLPYYILVYAVTLFFQAAVIAGATQRLNGGDPTLGSALGAAGRKIVPLTLWSIIAGTVGVAIRAAEDRSALIGKIVMSLVGVAWTLATFFMVPVLLFEGHSLRGSFRASWHTLKSTWGEAVVGSTGIGLFGSLCAVPIVLFVVFLAAQEQVVAAVVTGGLGLAILGVVFSALQGVYVAALYRFANHGNAVDASHSGFEAANLSAAFQPRGHRSPTV